MPIDTSIYGLLKPVSSPLLNLGEMFEQGQRLRAGQLDLREQERAQQEAEAIRQAYSQQYGGGSAPAGLAGAQPTGPPAGLSGAAPARYGPALTGMLAQYQAEGAPVSPQPGAAEAGGQAGQAPPAGLAGAGPMTKGDRQGQRAFIDRLYTISPKAGREAEKHAYDSQDLQLKQHIQRVDYLGRVADGVLESDNPQAAWEVARAMLIEQGMPPSQVPEVVDLNYVRQLSGMGHDSGDKLRLAQAELYRANAQRERGKAPDYGLGEGLNTTVYEMFGAQIPPGGRPSPTQVQQARAEYSRTDPQSRLNRAKARREEYEADATEGVRGEMAGRPRRMSAADIDDAMAQTGYSRAEVIAAARENDFTVEDAPDTGPAPSTAPSTAPSAVPSAVPSTAPSAVPSTAPSAVPSAVPSTAQAAPAVPRRSPTTTATTTAPATAPGTATATGTATAPATAPASTSGDVTRLRRLEALRDTQEEQVALVKRKWGTSEAGKTAVSQAEQELTRRNTEIDRLRTRLERQQEQAKERRTPSAEVRDELLAMGVPVEAASAEQVAQAQSSIQTRKERTGIERELDKPLSTEDAALYGVPPGTTAREMRQIARGESPQPTGTLPPLKGDAAKTYQLGARMNRSHGAVAALEDAGITNAPFLLTLEQTAAKLTGAVGSVVGVATGGGFAGATAGGGAGLGAGSLASPLVNVLRTPEQRRYVTAQLAFIAGILRKESGAAITAEEYRQYSAIYFAQTGDDADTIAAKRAMRQEEIASLQEQFPNRPFPTAPSNTTKVRPQAEREPGILQPRPSERPKPGQRGWPYQPGGSLLD